MSDPTDNNAPKPPAETTPAQAPQFKPRKVFVAKKITPKSDKPQEYRLRHILVSSADAANLIHGILQDFEKELAEQPSEDLDKEFEDRKKIENFFARVAKKYSICQSRAVGGEVGWVNKDMEMGREVLNRELVDTAMNAEKFKVQGPVRTPRGHHLILVCETRTLKAPEEKKPETADPRYEAMMNDPKPQPQSNRNDIPT
jgi:parvulin-like peptidyl-prolyl isomerase